MFLRDSIEYRKEQTILIKKLVDEAVNGITVLDTLPDIAQPLQEEAEAMYFESVRNFFENTISHRIMTIHQDLYEGK